MIFARKCKMLVSKLINNIKVERITAALYFVGASSEWASFYRSQTKYPKFPSLAGGASPRSFETTPPGLLRDSRNNAPWSTRFCYCLHYQNVIKHGIHYLSAQESSNVQSLKNSAQLVICIRFGNMKIYNAGNNDHNHFLFIAGRRRGEIVKYIFDIMGYGLQLHGWHALMQNGWRKGSERLFPIIVLVDFLFTLHSCVVNIKILFRFLSMA